jgi:hypothetical protein
VRPDKIRRSLARFLQARFRHSQLKRPNNIFLDRLAKVVAPKSPCVVVDELKSRFIFGFGLSVIAPHNIPYGSYCL